MGKIYSYFSYPSSYEYILRIIEIVAPFLAASYTSFYFVGSKKYTKALKRIYGHRCNTVIFFGSN